eukprot:16287424-Heterocapsa_arctica.AAC.1
MPWVYEGWPCARPTERSIKMSLSPRSVNRHQEAHTCWSTGARTAAERIFRFYTSLCWKALTPTTPRA